MSYTTVDGRRTDSPIASGASNGESCGVASPRLVIRGETHEQDESALASVAFVDWIAFTVRPPQSAAHQLSWMRDMLVDVFRIPQNDWSSKGRGWNGYAQRIDLGAFGLFAHGGQAQKGTFHAELNAQACRLVQDWNAVRVWGETYNATITRVDLAHDDFAAREISVESALRWLRDGIFASNGRPPAAHLIDDLGSKKGKTLYIGRRESGKVLRVYEKGKQLGDETSPWVRAEVELRNKSRLIPWLAVTQAGQFLAGAYPALRFLSAEQSRLRTVQRAGQISYATMVKNLRTQGGKSLHVMTIVHGGDAAAVLTQVVREGVPKRLAGYSRDDLLPSEGGRGE